MTTISRNSVDNLEAENCIASLKIFFSEAEADKILQDAEATKQERINEANGQVARFNSMYQEYVKYPEVTKKRMFYEAMEDILPDVKVVIQSKDGTTNTILPLDSFVTDSSSSDSVSSTGSIRSGSSIDTDEDITEEE